MIGTCTYLMKGAGLALYEIVNCATEQRIITFRHSNIVNKLCAKSNPAFQPFPPEYIKAEDDT